MGLPICFNTNKFKKLIFLTLIFLKTHIFVLKNIMQNINAMKKCVKILVLKMQWKSVLKMQWKSVLKMYWQSMLKILVLKMQWKSVLKILVLKMFV